MVLGWGKARKEIEVFDVSNLPNVERIKCNISGKADYFKYGHSSTKIKDDLVMIYGGMSSGGYQAAINLMTQVEVIYHDEQRDDRVASKKVEQRDEERHQTPVEDVVILSETETETGTETETENVVRNTQLNGGTCNVAGSSGSDDGDIDEESEDKEYQGNNGGGGDDDDDDDDDEAHMSSEATSDGDTDNSDEEDPSAAVEVVLTVVHQSSAVLGHVPSDPAAALYPTPRGYHTATSVSICQQNYLLVWGGLGNRLVMVHDEEEGPQVVYRGTKTLTHLECLNCDTMRWHTQVLWSGPEPSARFGHSCTFHPRTNSLIVMGGSNGMDLLRNWVELREVTF